MLQDLRESWRIGELLIAAVQVSLLGRTAEWGRRELGVNRNI